MVTRRGRRVSCGRCGKPWRRRDVTYARCARGCPRPELVSRLRNHVDEYAVWRRALGTADRGRRTTRHASVAPWPLGSIAARGPLSGGGTGPATPVAYARRLRDTPPTFTMSSEIEH